MTIDLYKFKSDYAHWVHDPQWIELLRLARLGQQREREREREKCGTCKTCKRCEPAFRAGELYCYHVSRHVTADWHCADWEEA